jgi:hypothetical protein
MDEDPGAADSVTVKVVDFEIVNRVEEGVNYDLIDRSDPAIEQ